MHIIKALSSFLYFSLPAYLFCSAAILHAAPLSKKSPIILNILSLGAGIQEAQNLAFFQPFNTLHPHLKIQAATWNGSLDTLKSMIVKGDNTVDLLISDKSTVSLGCRKGLLVPLLQNAPKTGVLTAATPISCSQPALTLHIGIGWNHKKFNTRQTWKDFWDVSRNPGRRGLYKGVCGTLEIALIADNVSPQDVYSVLSTPEGVNRAFHKLSQIKPYISWWSTFAEAINLLQNNQVLMTTIPAEEIQSFNANSPQKFDLNISEGLTDELGWAIPAPYNKAVNPLTSSFLAFLKEAKPNNVFKKLYSLPDTDHSSSLTDSTRKKTSKDTLPASSDANILQINTKFWDAHYANLNRRFKLWLARP